MVRIGRLGSMSTVELFVVIGCTSHEGKLASWSRLSYDVLILLEIKLCAMRNLVKHV